MRAAFAITLRNYLLLLTVGLAMPLTAQNETNKIFHYERSGFSMKLPENWKEIPTSVLKKHFEEAAKVTTNGKAAEFEYGFRPSSSDGSVDYPYIVVGAKKGRLLEAEVAKLPRMKGLNKRAEQGIKMNVGPAVGNARLEEPIYDPEKLSLWMGISMQVTNVGPVRGIGAMRLTDDGYILICCYATDQDFDSLGETFVNIIDSVSVKNPYRPDSSKPSGWRRILGYALAGGLIGLLIGVAAHLGRYDADSCGARCCGQDCR